MRTATLARKTRETDIALSLNLDGTGAYSVSTGIGFFDHMLELLSRHSLIDLDLRCEGDLRVDYHHTVEDVGLALGTALDQALGDRRGIRRYGFFMLPMDDARADVAVFGQKDAQQLAVIRQMVSDLNMPVQVVGCPIVRESDGLAKSSRNTYLNAQERQAALVLSRSLAEGRKLLEAGTTDTGRVLARIEEVLKSEPLARIDYVQAVDADTIEPVHKVSGNVLFAIAVYIGKTRLIDNFYWTAE